MKTTATKTRTLKTPKEKAQFLLKLLNTCYPPAPGQQIT